MWIVYRQAIKNHPKTCSVHLTLVERLKDSARIYNEDLTLYANQKIAQENVVTARVFRSVYTGVAAMGTSINSLPEMIELMRVHQTIVGPNCKSPGTLNNICKSISDSMHTRLCKHMQESRLPMVLLADGSNDICKWNYFYMFSQGTKTIKNASFEFSFAIGGSHQLISSEVIDLMAQLINLIY